MSAAHHGHGKGPVPDQKPKQFKATLMRLLRYLKPRTLRITIVFIAGIIGTFFTIFAPKVMGDTITVVFEGAYNKLHGSGGGIDFTEVGRMLLSLALLYVISSLFIWLQQFLMASVAQRTVYDLREAVFYKLDRLPLRYFDSHAHGDTISRVANDIDLIGTTLQQSLTQFMTSIITIVGIIVMMLTMSPILTLISVLSLPLSIFVIKPFLKKSQRAFGQQQQKLCTLNDNIEEMYTGHQVVKVFNQEEKSIREFDQENEELYKASSRAQFISGIIMPIMSFIGNLSYVLISIVGGILVTQRAISVGDIQAFITYTKQFTQPISQTANIANVIQSTVAAAERVFELLDEEEQEQETAVNEIKKTTGAVELDSVAFGYDDNLLMHDLNVSVEPGQTVAIVGPTGAGKTTLINL